MNCEFRAKPLSVLGWGLILAMPIVFFGAGLVVLPLIWKIVMLPAAVFCFAAPVFWFVRMVTRLQFDGETLSVFGPLSLILNPRAPIEAWFDAATGELRQGKKRAFLNLSMFREADLKDRILSISSPANQSAIESAIQSRRKFRTTKFCTLGGSLIAYSLVALVVATALEPDRIVQFSVGFLVCFAFAKLVYDASKWDAQVDGTGLVLRRFGKTISSTWADVESVTKHEAPSDHRWPRPEWLWISAHGVRLPINQAIDDFPLLRDVILQQVNESSRSPTLLPPKQSPSSSQHP